MKVIKNIRDRGEEGYYLDRVVIESLSRHSGLNLKEKEPARQRKDPQSQMKQLLVKPWVGKESTGGEAGML